MDTASAIVGRWLYTDESSWPEDGTVLQFTKSTKGVSACFFLQENAIDAKMECTLNKKKIVIEEVGAQISNRYDGTLSDDGCSIKGSWLCTKSSMTGKDATTEGEKGLFELKKDKTAVKEDAKLRFVGKWIYSDDYTMADDGTLLQFTITEDGKLSASFLLEPEDAGSFPAKCSLSADGKGVTINEEGDHICNDYVGVIDSTGEIITGTWTCVKSEDEETSVGDTGMFKLEKSQ